MIIRINNEYRVVSRIDGKICENIIADNVKSFEVDTVPPVSAGEFLLFNPETKEFYTEINPAARTMTAEDRKAIREAIQSKEKALKWLADNDWKVNKRMLGEWAEDDERWLEYLQGRLVARQKIDMADLIINSK